MTKLTLFYASCSTNKKKRDNVDEVITEKTLTEWLKQSEAQTESNLERNFFLVSNRTS